MGREIRIAVAVVILAACGFAAFRGGFTVLAICLWIFAAAIAAVFYLLVLRPTRIPRESVLEIRLAGRIPDYAAYRPLDQLLGRPFQSLYHLRLALVHARTDWRVRAVIVEIAGLRIGLAAACELHDLLRSISAAGKRVIAILAGDSASTHDYVVASGAGEIVSNPDTTVALMGVAAGGVFLKAALEKFNVSAQAIQWKEYKGAAETFTRDAMSPALRESMERVIADWQTVLCETIASSRKLEPEAARRLVAAGFLSAKGASEARLIDRLAYTEDVETEFDPEKKGKPFVALYRYLRRAAYRQRRRARHLIAVVHGLGPVIAGEPPAAGDFISPETTASDIERLARVKRVRAIVLRVNSPGGSAVGSDLVWRAVQEARRKGKAVVVSMGDVAASGGYYVSAGADAIVAEPATLTGSIGVVYAKFSLPRLLAQLGVGIDYAKSDPISDAFSISREMTQAELQQVDKVMGELYATFTSRVAEGRKLDPAKAEEIARGRVWSGIAAKEKGLVDDLGGLERAVTIAREKAGLRPGERHRLIAFPAPRFRLPIPALRPAAKIPGWLSVAGRAMNIPEEWAAAIFQLLGNGSALFLSLFF
jgi:protease IV